MQRIFTGLWFLLLFFAPGCMGKEPDATAFRHWTTQTGQKSKVRLQLVEQSDATIQLRREDTGKIVSIPLANLSKSDQEFVAHSALSGAPVQAATDLVATDPKLDDWPCYRGPNRNGISNAKLNLLDQPREIWSFDSLGNGRHGSAVVVGGKVFINGGWIEPESMLFCLDANTGELIWKSRSGLTHSTPTVRDGKVYVVGDKQFARCFDAKTGELIWKSEKMPDSRDQRHYGHAGSPLIFDDLLIANFGGGVGLRLSDGKEVWRHEGYPGLATPVLFESRGKPAVAIFLGDRLVARDPRSGESLWSIDRPADLGVNACDPIFLENDSRVFLSSSYAHNRAMYDISGNEPEELWTMGSGSSYPSGVLVNGKLYGMAGGFGRINLDTGARESRGPGAKSVLVIDDHWIFLSDGGKLEIGSLESDKFVAKIETRVAGKQTWNAPAYWQGKLYVRNQEGTLVCLQIGEI